jgi:23S rRNA (guanine745-N1)-methyltransferase
MIADVVAYLRCPVCGQPLSAAPGAVRCPRGHSFDQARQGYVHLAAGPVAHAGDSAPMIAARADFLAAGHYHFIAAALAACPLPDGLVVDVGAGTGYHLGAVLDAHPGAVGLAVDVSKPALRRAARAHPRAAAALCDAWRGLPLSDAGTAAVMNVFAPRNGREFARVLRPDGVLLVVTPTAAHLHELVTALGLLSVDPAKEDRVAAGLSPWFAEVSTEVHERTLRLDRREVSTLIGMGPSAWHTDPATLADRIAALPEPVPVTASVRLSRYRGVAAARPFHRCP